MEYLGNDRKLDEVLKFKDIHGKQLKSKGCEEVLRTSKMHDQIIYPKKKKLDQWSTPISDQQAKYYKLKYFRCTELANR